MASKTTKTTVKTNTSTRVGRDESGLSWEEEMVVRMRQGLSEADSHVLEFRGRGTPELRAQLTLMEADLLATMHGIGPLADAGTEIDHGLKSRILSKLSEIDG